MNAFAEIVRKQLIEKLKFIKQFEKNKKVNKNIKTNFRSFD